MIKRMIATVLLSLSITSGLAAQETEGYKFTDVVSLKTTPVKNQAATGTCWCFATTSFFETELLRMGRGEYDLSEMFIVRQKYFNQTEDNYLRQGNGNVGQGSLSHTWVNAFKMVGIVPEEVYSGINYDSKTHNHSELSQYVAAISQTSVKLRKRSPQYYAMLNNIFDTYLGKVPETFTYKGKQYTPKSFGESLNLNFDDYVEITSFTHKPYYQPFALEVRDNWEGESQYNVPLDEMMEIIDYALNKGYSVLWDGDVSEKGFSHKNGVAINPVAEGKEEVKVTPEIRQEGYESFVTTDDHLMHLTGIAKDQYGTKYYITKNSWGVHNSSGGFLNMSESYVRAKTIYVMLHKDAIPAAIAKKLFDR